MGNGRTNSNSGSGLCTFLGVACTGSACSSAAGTFQWATGVQIAIVGQGLCIFLGVACTGSACSSAAQFMALLFPAV